MMWFEVSPCIAKQGNFSKPAHLGNIKMHIETDQQAGACIAPVDSFETPPASIANKNMYMDAHVSILEAEQLDCHKRVWPEMQEVTKSLQSNVSRRISLDPSTILAETCRILFTTHFGLPNKKHGYDVNFRMQE